MIPLLIQCSIESFQHHRSMHIASTFGQRNMFRLRKNRKDIRDSVALGSDLFYIFIDIFTIRIRGLLPSRNTTFHLLWSGVWSIGTWNGNGGRIPFANWMLNKKKTFWMRGLADCTTSVTHEKCMAIARSHRREINSRGYAMPTGLNGQQGPVYRI